MSTFNNEFDDLPSEDEISEFLAFAGGNREHPYNPFPTQDRPRPDWRGGPPLPHADELGYLNEQDDQ